MAGRALVMGLFLTAMLAACANARLDYRNSIEGIAHDIEGLKGDYPQLHEFSAARHVKPDAPEISYGYHTRRAAPGPGWMSGVPSPDEDGIWFYIDLHSPESTLQIHTQPAALPYCVGAMRLSFLVIEGKKTKRVQGALWEILKRRGATRCE
jgi:hypothetical protein